MIYRVFYDHRSKIRAIYKIDVDYYTGVTEILGTSGKQLIKTTMLYAMTKTMRLTKNYRWFFKNYNRIDYEQDKLPIEYKALVLGSLTDDFGPMKDGYILGSHLDVKMT